MRLDDAWYTGVADELARCLTDAQTCAEACEALLEAVTSDGDTPRRQVLVDAIVAPAAVARVLVDLIDEPEQLVLAAAALCRDAAVDAVAVIGGAPEAQAAVAALRACAESCASLLAAS